MGIRLDCTHTRHDRMRPCMLISSHLLPSAVATVQLNHTPTLPSPNRESSANDASISSSSSSGVGLQFHLPSNQSQLLIVASPNHQITLDLLLVKTSPNSPFTQTIRLDFTQACQCWMEIFVLPRVSLFRAPNLLVTIELLVPGVLNVVV